MSNTNTFNGRTLTAAEGFVWPSVTDTIRITFNCQDCGICFHEELPLSAITKQTATQIFFDLTKLRSNSHCVKCLEEQEEASK